MICVFRALPTYIIGSVVLQGEIDFHSMTGVLRGSGVQHECIGLLSRQLGAVDLVLAGKYHDLSDTITLRCGLGACCAQRVAGDEKLSHRSTSFLPDPTPYFNSVMWGAYCRKLALNTQNSNSSAGTCHAPRRSRDDRSTELCLEASLTSRPLMPHVLQRLRGNVARVHMCSTRPEMLAFLQISRPCTGAVAGFDFGSIGR